MEVEAPLVSRSVKSGDAVEVTRKLRDGAAPAFRFEEATSRLTSWSQSFAFDQAAALPGRIETSFSIEGDLAGSTVAFQHRLALACKHRIALASDSGASVAAAVKQLHALNGDFAAFQGPAEIASKVDALAEAARDTPVAALGELAKERLALYRADNLGAPAADFTLESLDGKQVSFREATRGKVVLLSFWGVACGPCRQEAPYLTRLQEKYAARGFTVWAVNGYDEPREEVEQFVDEKKLKHPILLLGADTALKTYGVEGFPSGFWVNHEGRIVGKEVGFSPELVPGMEKRIESLLAAREKKK